MSFAKTVRRSVSVKPPKHEGFICVQATQQHFQSRSININSATDKKLLHQEDKSFRTF